MLGPVDLMYPASNPEQMCCPGTARDECGCRGLPTNPPLLYGIDWVICGGESGHGARPMHPDWARSLRDQCKAAGVPFFFKQWGDWWPMSRTDGIHEFPFGSYNVDSRFGFIKRGKRAAGRLLDGVEHSEFPS
jgi:hypothetical protein